MIVFDAGVLIAYLDADDAFHEAAVAFMEEYEEWEFAASALTVAECLVRPARAGRSARVLAVFERLGLVQLELSADDAPRLADTRATSNLTMSDAVVLFTAEGRGAELVTTDLALARAAEQRGVTAHTL